MKHVSLNIICLVIALSVLVFTVPAKAQTSCENLKGVKLDNVTFTLAESITPPWDVPVQSGFLATPDGLKVEVPFCRVAGFSSPGKDSRIGFEIWMPVDQDWNGRFLAVGNPGFIGSVAFGGLARIVSQGYVTASTDTGHVDEGYEWAIGHPEKWVDWGHRAVHETTVVTKHLARVYYGRPVQYSYWNSCHNGGNQGLNEAQRYPEDFDGIVASDPAFYVSRLQSGSMYLSWVSLRDGVEAPGYIPESKYPVMHRAALDHCDADDGLADGIITNPMQCDYDPETIVCHGPDSPSCLTPAQVETAKKIYSGAKFSDGTPIYSGFEPGSELGWGLMTGGPEPFWVNYGYFKGMVYEDPDWDFRDFDADRTTRLAESKTGYAVDGKDPNLEPFRDSGGKIILSQAWNETGVPPRTLVHYYQQVVDAAGDIDSTREFARLFMVPASGGCPGFRNPGDFNTLEALQRWVEQGEAPDRIIYKHRSDGKVYRTRPVCAWPATSRYTGSGNPDDSDSFSCIEP